MDAEKWAGLLQALEAKKQDLSYEQMMTRMSNSRQYQANPIPVVRADGRSPFYDRSIAARPRVFSRGLAD